MTATAKSAISKATVLNQTNATSERRRDTRIVKHSLVIAGHRTSISLENPFWDELKLIASDRQQSLASLVCEIDATRGEANLSSAIRVFVLETLRD